MIDYPKVCIIIPTYNRAHYLPLAIEGALAQDYKNLEIIVSDDGSTDNTQEVIEKYLKDNRFKYYRNKENIGAFRNLKRLIYEYIDSDWFLLQSDDDYLIDNFYISKCIELINRHKDKNIVLVGANYDYYLENSGRIESNSCRVFPEVEDGEIYFLNYYKNFFSAAFSLQNTNVVKKSKSFMPEGSTSDGESILMLCLNGYVGFISETVGVFRIHDRSYVDPVNFNSNEIIKIMLNNLFFIENPYKYAKKNQIFPDEAIENWRKNMLIMYFRSYFIHLMIHKKIKEAISVSKIIFKEYPFIPVFRFLIYVLIGTLVNKNGFLNKLKFIFRYKLFYKYRFEKIKNRFKKYYDD